MNDMIERVARALAVKRNTRRVHEGDEDIGVMPFDFEDARAAIEAMSEPTPEMIEAGAEVCGTTIPQIWKSMNAAALR